MGPLRACGGWSRTRGPAPARNIAEPADLVLAKNPKLTKVANKEKMVPRKYISKDGYSITKTCKTYLEPLIQGEDYPPYYKGIPKRVKLKNISVTKMLNKNFVV